MKHMGEIEKMGRRQDFGGWEAVLSLDWTPQARGRSRRKPASNWI